MPKRKELDQSVKDLIIAKHQKKKSYRCIAEGLKVPVSTVGYIIKKWKEFGTTKNMPRSGAPRKISERCRRRIMRTVQNDPFVTREEIQNDLSSMGTSVCKRTISTELHRGSLKSRKPRKTPLLKKHHRKSRLEFAKKYINEEPTFYDDVIWSDETKIELFGINDANHVWREDGSAYDMKNTIPTVKHGGGNIMIWGCFSSQGVGTMEIIEGRMNGALYRGILDNNLQRSVEKMGLSGDWRFQQDNDPKHTAKETQKWFKDNGIEVLQWPSQSPDLNPIENLWRILKKQIRARRPSNIQQLKIVAKEEWEKIPLDICQNLIKTYSNRLAAVIKAKGGPIKY